MSKRLQVIVDDVEFSEIQRAARQSHMTSSEWIRQALRKVQRSEPTGDVKEKLAVVRRAAEHAYPTADIDQMIAEIERGQVENRSA